MPCTNGKTKRPKAHDIKNQQMERLGPKWKIGSRLNKTKLELNGMDGVFSKSFQSHGRRSKMGTGGSLPPKKTYIV